jgi:hypothetical protein
VAGLPSELVDDDQEAKQFDLLILRLQLGLLRHEKSFTRLSEGVREIDSIGAGRAVMIQNRKRRGSYLSSCSSITASRSIRRTE